MKPVILRLLCGVLIFLAPSLSAWAVDYPLAPAEGVNYAALLQNPTEISFTVETSPPPPATTASVGDLHAVYPVPLALMREVVTDYNGYPSFSPRVTASSAQRIGDDPPTWNQRLTLSFRVLFFGSDYDYYLTVTEPPLSGSRSDRADEFAMHYRMERSLDGKLADVAGSWYLRAVEIDGAEHTYARYFNSIHFAHDQFGLRLALRNLGARDMKLAMDAFYREAERRREQ